MSDNAVKRAHINDEEEEEDWLESEDEKNYMSAPPLSSMKGDYEMAARDTSKVQGKMYDDGYRTGIGIGKEAKIQEGFDQGYNQKGALAGQKYGHLLGTVTAMEQYISRSGSATMSGEVASLKNTIKRLQIDDLVEPDWEALEHERQHGADLSRVKRETEEEKSRRDAILDNLQGRADEMAHRLLYTE